MISAQHIAVINAYMILLYLREKNEWYDELDGFEEHPEEIEKAGRPRKQYPLPFALRNLRKSQEEGKRR